MDASRKHRVLVADHDLAFLDQIADRLFGMGMEVDFAESGRNAMRLATQEKYDLVVTEIAMPIHNGLEIMRRVKQSSPATPVILFTFKDTQDWASQAVDQGAHAYLLRPLHDMKVFDQTVHDAIKCETTAAQPSAAAPQAKAARQDHKASAARRAAEAAQPSAAERIPDGIIELNARGQIASCNPAAKRWLVMDSSDEQHPLKRYILALAARAAPPQAQLVCQDHQVHVMAKLINAESGEWRIGIVIEDKGLQATMSSAGAPAFAFEPEPYASKPELPQTVSNRTANPPQARQKEEVLLQVKAVAEKTLKTLLDALECLGAFLWKEMQRLREVDWASYLPRKLEDTIEENDPEFLTTVSNRLSNFSASRN